MLDHFASISNPKQFLANTCNWKIQISNKALGSPNSTNPKTEKGHSRTKMGQPGTPVAEAMDQERPTDQVTHLQYKKGNLSSAFTIIVV